MNIVCRKTKCKYNDNQACMSEKLMVDIELNCEMYEPIEKNSLQDVSRDMMEIAPEIAPFRHNKDVDIGCKANCIFNKESKCMANGIFVNGETAEMNKKVENTVKNDEKCKKNCKNLQKNKKYLFFGEERALKHNNKIGQERNINLNKLECACVSKEDFDGVESSCKCDKHNRDGEAKCFTFANK